MFRKVRATLCQRSYVFGHNSRRYLTEAGITGKQCIYFFFLSEGDKQESSVFFDSKQLSPGLQLYQAAFEKNLPDMAEALAHGAEVNWVNIEENKATPLIQAVRGVCGIQHPD